MFVVALAAIWVFAVFADARAQGKEHEKGKNDKDKKNERMIEGAKLKYKPRGMSEKDLMDWKDGNPPGESRGEKTGWGEAGAPPGQIKEHGEHGLVDIHPPGSENWDMRKKEDWHNKLEQSRVRIFERIRDEGGNVAGRRGKRDLFARKGGA